MIKGKFKWDKNPSDAVEALSKGLRNKACRIALNAGAAPMKAAAIAQAPADSGALKKSFRIRVKNYKNENRWVAVIGAKSDFVKKKGKKVKTDKRPGNYLTLVDKGTQHMRGRQFMKAAYDSSISQSIQTMANKLRQQIAQLSAKS